MTNDSRRHITVVLDRSGSMHLVRSDTEGGLNAFIKEQTRVSKDLNKATTVTLIEFNDQINPVYRNKAISQVGPYELHPRGSTALLDAIGVAILELDEYLAGLLESRRPGEIVLAIVTDGEENASQEHTLEGIKKMITDRTEAGWQFIFLGADQDAITVGNRMGVVGTNSVSYASANTRAAWGTASSMVTRGTVSGDYSVTDTERDRLSKG